jgi:hypothetical protein
MSKVSTQSTQTQSTGTEDGTAATISDNDCFDLLSKHRRRYALHYLKGDREEASLGELSEQIAAWENGIPLEEVSADERKRVYTSLQQIHLPRMAKMGAVEFDERAGEIELGPAAEELDIYLEVVRGRDIPWSQLYLGLGVVNLALLAAVAVDTVPLTLIPDIGWAAFSATMFLVTALCHYVLNRREMLLGNNETPPEVST